MHTCSPKCSLPLRSHKDQYPYPNSPYLCRLSNSPVFPSLASPLPSTPIRPSLRRKNNRLLLSTTTSAPPPIPLPLPLPSPPQADPLPTLPASNAHWPCDSVGNSCVVPVPERGIPASDRTRYIECKALTAARCSAIPIDDPWPSASFRPEGRKRPMEKMGDWVWRPVSARTLDC